MTIASTPVPLSEATARLSELTRRVLLGLVFGVGAGAFTRIYRGDEGIYAKACLLAAAFWTVGVVGRTAFGL